MVITPAYRFPKIRRASQWGHCRNAGRIARLRRRRSFRAATHGPGSRRDRPSALQHRLRRGIQLAAARRASPRTGRGPFPAVVYVHGGGRQAGNKTLSNLPIPWDVLLARGLAIGLGLGVDRAGTGTHEHGASRPRDRPRIPPKAGPERIVPSSNGLRRWMCPNSSESLAPSTA